MNAISLIHAPSVRLVEPGEPRAAERIDLYVSDHPDGTIFHRPAWSRMVQVGCGQQGRILVAERAGRICGMLPLTEIRSALFGNALVSAGFATRGGLLADDDQAAQALADHGWSLARTRGYGSIELRGGPLPEGFAAETGIYSSFSRALDGNEESLWKAIPRKARAEIRKGQSFGLHTSIGSDPLHLHAFFRVYSESVRNLGTPVFPRRLFEAALAEFGAEAEVIAVWQDGRPLAAMLNLYFRSTGYTYWGGGVRDARELRANDLVYWEAMRRSLVRGMTRSDFSRSKIGTGPWQRKRNWGFDEEALVYGVRTAAGRSARQINPLDPRHRLKVAAWKKMPLWAANRVGPFLSRGLG